MDLNPEADPDKPEVATYTYDAGGERSIRYLPGRFDAYYSAKEAGKNHRLEAILYPNSLVTVKTLPLPEEIEELENVTLTKYTKHYYIGSERVASALGSIKSLGLLCEIYGADAALIAEMNDKVEDAAEMMQTIYDTFEKDRLLPTPFLYRDVFQRCDFTHYQDMYHPYWYHPDHLGSSSYITNLAGVVSQHMEYLPFGELLVDEHLNSHNSPFKFSAKEFDSETGMYYFGARYYEPKWSIWISVDPAKELYPSHSPYNYTANNPINNYDPNGKWWFSKNAGNRSARDPNSGRMYRVPGASQYSVKMSSVRNVYAKQNSWGSYLPGIGTILNASAMAQKMEDPTMKLDGGDYASLILGGYFKGTRKLIKAAGAYEGGAKIALKLSEEFSTLATNIASSPELKESWIELAVMEHFAGETSSGGNAIGALTGAGEDSYTTIFNFNEDFVSELQGIYGGEFDALNNTSGMNRDSYIDNKVESHLQQMFEDKKTELMKKIDD